MSRARKRQIMEAAVPENEVATEIRAGLETLARALCALAVERHATSLGDHREKSAILWIDVASDFREVKVTPETRNWLAALFKIDPRSMGKGVR